MLFEVSLKNAKMAVAVVVVANFLVAIVIVTAIHKINVINFVTVRSKLNLSLKHSKFDNVTNFHTRLLNLA